MADQKPPRLVEDELSTLMALLQYQRDSFVRKVSDVDDAAARRQLVGSDTTLLWLTRHLARAEQMWVLDRFAGQEDVSNTDAIENELTNDAAIESYRQTWTRVEAVIGSASLDDLCRRPGDLGDANLRWVLMHLLEETARHAGHADIIRELIDGQTGR